MKVNMLNSTKYFKFFSFIKCQGIFFFLVGTEWIFYHLISPYNCKILIKSEYPSGDRNLYELVVYWANSLPISPRQSKLLYALFLIFGFWLYFFSFFCFCQMCFLSSSLLLSLSILCHLQYFGSFCLPCIFFPVFCVVLGKMTLKWVSPFLERGKFLLFFNCSNNKISKILPCEKTYPGNLNMKV